MPLARPTGRNLKVQFQPQMWPPNLNSRTVTKSPFFLALVINMHVYFFNIIKLIHYDCSKSINFLCEAYATATSYLNFK